MSCAAFLELCNGNCTDNTAFKDACIVECKNEMQQIYELIVSLFFFIGICVVVPIILYYRRQQRLKKKKESYSAVSQAPQAQVIGIGPMSAGVQSLPQVPATISPEQVDKYDSRNFTVDDWDEYGKVNSGQQRYMTTHDGAIIDKNLTIVARRRGAGALNQPALF